MLKITIGVTGLREDSGRDDGIERRFVSGVTGSSKDLGRDDGIKETLILRNYYRRELSKDQSFYL